MDLPDPGIEVGSPALEADSLPTELSGKTLVYISKSYGKCKAESAIDSHIKEKKQSKHKAKYDHPATREDGKKEREEKNLWTQTPNN